MTPSQKQAALRRLMRDYSLTRRALAERVGYSKAAVDTWLAPPDARCYVEIQDRTLKYVTLKVKEN